MEEEKLVDQHDNVLGGEIKCKSCSAQLTFTPGTIMLGCEYCGAENEIDFKVESIEELDFDEYISNFQAQANNVETVTVVRCQSCSAQVELRDNLVADECDFCGTPLAIKSGSSCTLIKPKSLLPFKITKDQGFAEFKKWVNSLWFAPNDLKRYAHSTDRLTGIYLPYWTYDADTHSTYTGMRGVNRTESYTTTVNGKSVTQTRTVTDWYPCSGYIQEAFDDVLVMGSKSLPKKYAEALDPWHLEELIPFDEKFLSGFKAEGYSVDLKEGFEDAKGKMDVKIRQSVRRHIGGDQQQIITLNTNHSDVTFKHVLLPLWLSAFRYNSKSYRFMINGRTGEVQGERPYSAWKITFFVLFILAVIAGIVFLVIHFKNK